MFKQIIWYALIVTIRYGESAKILGIVPTPSYSHQIVFHPLWRELSLRGHHLTVLTTDPMNDPSLTNLTEIDLHFTYEFWNKNVTELLDDNKDITKGIDIFINTMINVIDLELNHPQVQMINQNKSEHFDLVIVEHLMPIMFAFGERFKCPIITMITIDAPSKILNVLGNPVHPVLNPDISLSFIGKLSFFQRLISVLFQNCIPLFVNKYVPNMQEVVYKHFGPNFPHVRAIGNNISLLFVNSNFALLPLRPLVPSVILIGGGMHIKPIKPLPTNLKQFLDDAKGGFIYFSLGTNVKSKDLSLETLQVLLQTFSELPYRVLWKFELDSLEEKPKNVMISKWVPQQDVLSGFLGHPNIKVFITQGGFQSTEEALFSRVPVLGMPYGGDQRFTINLVVEKGFGLSVDRENLQKDDFKLKILELAQNQKYREKAEEIVKLVLDQPMTGLERAVWWTEYVLRHKGAKHLRSPYLDIPSYQYYLLDVIGFCLGLIGLILFIIVRLIRTVLKLLKNFSKSKRD